MLCVCTDSVSEVVEGVDMVTMAVVTVRVLWALSRLLAAVPDSRALREERERDMGAIRTWMSFSSSRSCLFPELDDRFWQTDRQTDTHTHTLWLRHVHSFCFCFQWGEKNRHTLIHNHWWGETGYVMFTFFVFLKLGETQVTSCSLF